MANVMTPEGDAGIDYCKFCKAEDGDDDRPAWSFTARLDRNGHFSETAREKTYCNHCDRKN